jgi:hypothetical protein
MLGESFASMNMMALNTSNTTVKTVGIQRNFFEIKVTKVVDFCFENCYNMYIE